MVLPASLVMMQAEIPLRTGSPTSQESSAKASWTPRAKAAILLNFRRREFLSRYQRASRERKRRKRSHFVRPEPFRTK